MTAENPFLWAENRRPSVFMPKPKPTPLTQEEIDAEKRREYQRKHWASYGKIKRSESRAEPVDPLVTSDKRKGAIKVSRKGKS